jgi:hypothetical protein
MRRQITCASPVCTSAPYSKVASVGDISDELHKRFAERSLLLLGQSVPIAPERREDFTRRHRAASSARPGPLGTRHRYRRT